MGRLKALVAIAFWIVLAAASAWILVMPRAFASLPAGEVWTSARLTTAINADELSALLVTNDDRGDVVVRTRSGTLAVVRTSLEPAPFNDPQPVLTTVAQAGRSEIVGKSDPDLAAYARAVATIPPVDTTVPIALWLGSSVLALSALMVWAAGRTSFRFSQPFGARFGVGTDRTP